MIDFGDSPKVQEIEDGRWGLKGSKKVGKLKVEKCERGLKAESRVENQGSGKSRGRLL
jgi:hypothetical protein